MESNVEKPSLLRILTTDGSSFLALIASLGIWVLYGVYSFISVLPELGRIGDAFSKENLQTLVSTGIIVTGLAIPLIILRVWTVWSTFMAGVEVPGQIIGISFGRNAGRVEYRYTYQGLMYRRGNGIAKTKRTKTLELDSQVTLVVHSDNPERAFIRDLYV
jgi:hypothetical protein